MLMSDSSNKSDVLRGIELGAVDFLEKPLSSLKLKNIWQHVVRKVSGTIVLANDCTVAAHSRSMQVIKHLQSSVAAQAHPIRSLSYTC